MLVPALTIVNSAGVASVTPGSVVHYTVTITNTGQTAYTGISVTDSLSGLLDDAAYNGDAAATAGSVSYASPVLTWTGSLAVGAAVTVTFSVTVNATDTGDKSLGTTVSTAAAGSNCPAGSTDARCSTSVPVLIPGLDLTVTANAASAAPGSVVSYTVVAANTGQTADTGVSFTASLAGVLDDAAYNGNAAATAGSVSYASPVLTWTGTLAAGASATITFSVTVNNPDTGDHRLTVTLTSAAAGSNCPADSTDPSCAVERAGGPAGYHQHRGRGYARRRAAWSGSPRRSPTPGRPRTPGSRSALTRRTCSMTRCPTGTRPRRRAR